MKNNTGTPVVSIVGASNSGKTTLIVRLIAELTNRGYRVASIKHTSHGFDIDRPGKDSFRHAEAGADAVVVVSKDRIAMVKKVECEMPLEDIVSLFGDDYDIILTEGYKSYQVPKIEILREGYSKGLISPVDELIAVVTDSDTATISALLKKIESSIKSAVAIQENPHADSRELVEVTHDVLAEIDIKPRFTSLEATGVTDLVERTFLKR
jgi:molybdopterin-guanine dinucleotide biosynthesis adapter protein